jgi:hypothetical protein
MAPLDPFSLVPKRDYGSVDTQSRESSERSFVFMQISDRADAENLVESQIGGITQADFVTLIRALRVPARCENRPWGYGKPREAYPCWIVLEHPESNTAGAYCAEGFGPTYPWGSCLSIFFVSALPLESSCRAQRDLQKRPSAGDDGMLDIPYGSERDTRRRDAARLASL